MMITYAAWAASAAWLAVLAVTALVTRPWRPATGPATLALRGEPPAVVSLLAGRLARDGYPATLLDLAARGWMGLGEAEPSRVMCRPSARPLDASLTGYERLALAHLEFRAAGVGAVPGTALDSGFEPGEDEFRERFAGEVRADARRRGLIRSRIGPGALVLLAAAGIPAAALATMALARHQQGFYLATPALIYLIILRAPWALHRRTRLTRAGQEALSAWLGFRLALIGSRSGPTAGTALLAVGGDRRIAYAAALGAAPDAKAAFSAATDRDRVWSSFGGSWHRVVVGRARHRYAPGTAALAGSAALCGLFAVLTLVILSEFGLKWAAVFLVFPGCIWWGSTLVVFGCATRAARLPALAEFDGQILKLWTEADPGDDNTPSHTRYCIAIDDGIREQAWALEVGHQVYVASRAGQLVHVRVDPRRNGLLAISPTVLASGDAPSGTRRSRVGPSG
ncbi:MAG TPA: hypothetical protein VH480_24390 [Streptosporangiaceae bacterium]